MKAYNLKINGNDYAVSINSIDGNTADVTVNGRVYKVEMGGSGTGRQASAPAAVPAAAAASASRPAPPVSAASEAAGVKSPLPGTVLSLNVEVGDKVAVGQKLLVLEAMKMENNIDSDREGVVKSINVKRGDSVLEGDVLLTIG